MRNSRHKLLFAAVFVFAAGFASAASAQFGRGCDSCMYSYEVCMSQPDAEQWMCARQHNLCAEPRNCPLMPEF